VVEPPAAPSPPRRPLLLAAFAALLVMGTVVLLDIGLRFVPGLWNVRPRPRAYVGEHRSRESPNFLADSVIGWRIRPGHQFRWREAGRITTYRANAQGFRSPHDFATRPRGALIALLGDSFTFGTGVEYGQTFGALIEARDSGRTLFNLALPGFGLDQMWVTLRYVALPLVPDLVIVAFVDQDLDRSLTAYRAMEGFTKPTFIVDGDSLRPQTLADRPSRLMRALERHSTLWIAWRQAMRRLGFRWPIGEWWRTNSALFRQMAEDARRAGVPIVFVRIPTQLPLPFPSWNALMGELGVEYVDLAHPDSLPPYPIHFPGDGHLDAAGHAFVAQRLAPIVARMIWHAEPRSPGPAPLRSR
jgi:hypothetical protein